MSGYYRASGEGRKRKVARAVKAVGHRIVNAIAHRIAGGEGRRKRVSQKTTHCVLKYFYKIKLFSTVII